MEAYTYSNLFDTKGIEYIIIIFFLVLLIPFWIIVNRESEAVIKIKEAMQALTAAVLRIPQGLFFSRNHTWLQLEKSGEARIGIDDFLLKVLGDVTVNPLKYPGEKVKKGELIVLVEQAGKQLKLHSPVSGQIIQFNMELTEDPSVLAEDPYGDGWLFSVQPDSWKAETGRFLLGKETQLWMEREVQHLKDFLSVSYSRYADPSMALAFQEGGELQMNPLQEMDAVVWDDFQNDFLDQIE